MGALAQIAILDDYQNVAREMADWSALDGRATVTVFNDHIADEEALIERLKPFDVLCVMRERTPLTRRILERLPNLRLIASTGRRNASIDLEAARERGIAVTHTGYVSSPTVELTWALILSSARNIVQEASSVRGGGWQTSIGCDLEGTTLGVLGVGNIGSRVAEIGGAFGMHVIAWSQHLDERRAAAVGARLVTREELFRRSDILSIHLVLSERTRGLVGAAELALMKPSAHLINTSRGPIVNETALIAALRERRLAGAALDVFDVEPLPADHPFRVLDNVLCTPHIGYVTRREYEIFYRDTVSNIVAWLESAAVKR
ncbi:MAG TPA: D-2-hydroxyacid dehydrogenase family protein [Verrucomicrobiae bacterium]|nr:D-2-hydroxyacid dehydrogenase family protein [Verrucomicrobiae bacterium]